MTPTVHPAPALLAEKAANQAPRPLEPTPASFGDLLRQHRLEAGLTQQLLAEQAGLSVHGDQKLERGATRPYPDTVRRLLTVLQLAPAVRAQFQTAAKPRPRRRAPPTAVPADSSTLPIQATPFVGRQAELARIAQLLATPVSRLVTLVGPGGIGKTRLAIEAARQQVALFPDGVYFVPLAPVESPHVLASVIAEALSVSLAGSETASTQLVRAVRDKKLLLVLDNFEHLLEGTGLLTDLLNAPNLKLVVTSRERLNLQEEWVEEVAGLAYPSGRLTDSPEAYAAVELFVQRAQQVQAGFSLADNTQAVVEICQRVEGMPLGLELAATWLRVMPCQEIAPQIERSLDFLTTAVRNVPERHRSVRAVLDHSWNLLSEAERQVLARLSIFRGGFDLEAADRVAGATLPVLASLADKSLIRFSTSGRYDLHELLRQYLADRLGLADPGEVGALTGRHLEFFAALADTAEAHLYGPEQETWFDRLEVEHDNLRAALAWSLRDGRVAAGMRMASALGFFWELRSHWYEANESLARLVESGVEAPPVVRARALGFAGVFALHAKDGPRARAFCEKSLRLARESGDPSSIAWALATLGMYVEGRASTDRAVALLDEALTLFREIGDAWGTSHALRRLGILLTLDGQYARARPLVEEALAGARAVGDKNALAWAVFVLGNVVWLQTGDPEPATAMFEEALSLSPEIRDWNLYMWVQFTLGAAARVQGNYARAQACYEQVLTLMRDRQVSTYLNWPELLASALAGLAGLAVGRGMPAEAARLFGAASHIPDPDPVEFFRVDREADVAAARSQLGDAAFDAAFSEGQAMTTDQSIDLALRGKTPRRRPGRPA